MRWFGYGCFVFSDDTRSVVVDPHDGKSLGIFPPNISADVVLCTHNTFARNCFRSIRGVHKDFNMAKGTVDYKGFTFTGIPTKSLYDGGENTAYRFTIDGVSILVCGCIGDIPDAETIERMKGVEILIVPIGEYATMSMEKINEFIKLVDAPIVIPSEYKAGGITLALSNLSKFSEGRCPDDYAYVGSEAEFTLEDIEDYSGVWIFDCDR